MRSLRYYPLGEKNDNLCSVVEKILLGKIAVGYDADLVVWDDKKEFVVTEEIIQHKNKITPYINKTLSGVIEQTYLAGRKVFENGDFSALNKGKAIYKN